MTQSGDSQRVVDGLIDLLERRINIIMGKAGPNWKRYVGPVYDPSKGSSGDGRSCSKCRKVSPTHARVCGSCGTIL